MKKKAKISSLVLTLFLLCPAPLSAFCAAEQAVTVLTPGRACLGPWLGGRLSFMYFMSRIKPLFSGGFRRPYDSRWRMLNMLGRSTFLSFLEYEYLRAGTTLEKLIEFKEYVFMFAYNFTKFHNVEDFLSDDDFRSLYMLAVHIEKIQRNAFIEEQPDDLAAGIAACSDAERERMLVLSRAVRKFHTKNARKIYGAYWDKLMRGYFDSLVAQVEKAMPAKEARTADLPEPSLADDFKDFVRNFLFWHVCEEINGIRIIGGFATHYLPFAPNDNRPESYSYGPGRIIPLLEEAGRILEPDNQEGPVWTIEYRKGNLSYYILYSTRAEGDGGDRIEIGRFTYLVQPGQVLIVGQGILAHELIFNSLADVQDEKDWLVSYDAWPMLLSA